MTSSRRRPLTLALAVVALVLVGCGEGRPARTGGDASRCARLSGDAARRCYRSEVGADLAALSGGKRILNGTPAFVSTEDRSVAFVCDLHARIGVAVGSSSDFTDALRPLS